MSYYGGGGATTGVSDHRLLSGRADANQHPATAVSVDATRMIDLVGASTASLQTVLEAIAGRSGAQEVAPVAATAIGAYRAVAFRADDTVELADHESADHVARLAGITTVSSVEGGAVRVCVDGTVRFDGWNWLPGAPVYVGRAGEHSQIPPASGFIQHIGFAIGRDAILVQVERSIRRL